MAIVKAFQGAHSSPQWSGVQKMMAIDGWKSVARLDILCVCMEAEVSFSIKNGKQCIFLFLCTKSMTFGG